ncbi:MAG: S9 family peptidase [Aggregatilineales bacterium]
MKKYLFDQFTATRLHGEVAYSHNGNYIAYTTNVSGQFNIWIVPSGGGFARQLTMFEDWSVRRLYWSHDDSKIAFTADKDGSENRQVFVVLSSGGWPEMLSNKLQAQYDLSGWSPDDSKLLYSTNDRNPAEKDPVEHDLKTGELHRLMTGHRNFATGYSPNGRYTNIEQFNGNTDQNIFVLDVESCEAICATPHESEAFYEHLGWHPESTGFYMLTNQDREFSNVAYYDLIAGDWKWFYTVDYDVERLLVLQERKQVLIFINVGGRTELKALTLEGEEVEVAELPVGVVQNASPSPDSSKIVLNYTTAKSASNIYEFDLETGDLLPLSQSMVGGIDPDHMIDPELIHYETFDGQQIPAWLYIPKTRGDIFPVLLSIHGGPETQERPVYNYSGMYQYLLNRGIGILAPNIRGSTGFGISYQKLIHRDWGGGELKDIEFAAKYLQSLDWVDNRRIGVFGASFGGYSTLNAITRLPDYWSVAVVAAGPSNLVNFVQSVPEFWKPVMKTWVGDAVEDYDLLTERSPITYLERIKVPLLVIHGANDPRVTQAESDQMVERMKALDIDVTYYVDPEEGHGPVKRANALKWWYMIAEYLEQHMLI